MENNGMLPSHFQLAGTLSRVLVHCATAKLAPIERAAMDHDMEQNMDDTEQRIREIEAEQDKLKSQVPPNAKAPVFSVGCQNLIFRLSSLPLVRLWCAPRKAAPLPSETRTGGVFVHPRVTKPSASIKMSTA